LRNIPSIAFSLGGSDLGFDFEVCAPIAVSIVERVLASAKTKKTPLLNVNFPALHLRDGGPPKGIRATRLGSRRYEDEVDVRQDPRGRDYYWIGGPNAFHDASDGSDTEAVDAGFVSITPLGLDATEHDHLSLANVAAGVSP
jgi:5'-nucleotidase